SCRHLGKFSDPFRHRMAKILDGTVVVLLAADILVRAYQWHPGDLLYRDPEEDTAGRMVQLPGKSLQD
ncbi:PDE8A, partial [Symbiodinium pilosum]